jgi:hypothetical protein
MSTAASIALVFLIIEMMVGAVIFLAISAGMVYLMHKLRGVVKRVMPRAQNITLLVANKTHDFSDIVAEPFIKAHSATAQARATLDGVKRRYWRS